MASPFALGVTGMAATGLGAITSAIGSIYQGSAQAAQYNYQSGVAQINSTLAKQNANYAVMEGGAAAQRVGIQTAQEVGAERAGQGFGNINVNTGSARAVQTSQREVGQLGEATAQYNAAQRAYGFNVKAAQDVAQAGALQLAASTSTTAGDIGAVSSVLGGVGSVSGQWLKGQQQGIFPT